MPSSAALMRRSVAAFSSSASRFSAMATAASAKVAHWKLDMSCMALSGRRRAPAGRYGLVSGLLPVGSPAG